jgi:hypothetical protein
MYLAKNAFPVRLSPYRMMGVAAGASTCARYSASTIARATATGSCGDDCPGCQTSGFSHVVTRTARRWDGRGINTSSSEKGAAASREFSTLRRWIGAPENACRERPCSLQTAAPPCRPLQSERVRCRGSPYRRHRSDGGRRTAGLPSPTQAGARTESPSGHAPRAAMWAEMCATLGSSVGD